VPVIIIPAECKYTPLQDIVLACDLKKVAETTPVTAIKDLLDATKAKLYVLNVSDARNPVTADASYESLMVETLFQEYHPAYHFLEGDDFTEVINQFATQHEVDLIITIPKKHGLFDKLFRRSHTKMLAFHSHVPLMVVHE
jgi:nucleotide-binding universal stress UspA family protein